ncbi:DNA repair protein RecO [bacterium]|nr:DNA repair protein RecO [bacterium]
MNSNQITGIVLKKIPYGDSDWIVTILTEEGMKLSAMAKGAKGSAKRFQGGLDLFSVFRFMIKPKGADFNWLESSDMTWGFAGARRDVLKFACASYFSEIILEFMQEKEEMPHVYSTFLSFLKDLNTELPLLPQTIPVFEHHMLSLFGYKPSLEQCVECSCKITPEQQYHFSTNRGGVICSVCFRGKSDYPLTYQVITKMMDGFSGEAFPVWKSEEVAQARHVLEYFLQYTAGKPFKSLSFLSSILQ